MIKAVIFDLGNTIIPFDFARSYARMTALCGHDTPEIRRRIGATDLVVRLESGQIDPEDFIRQISALLEIEISFDEFLDLWGSIFERETLIPDSLPATLRENGYRLVVLSNTNDLHMRFIRERYPILRHFHSLVLSHEVGAQKPSPKIYAEAIRQAGCLPGECFFTDDIEQYVEGAKQAGIDAVQFKKYEQLREELLARGVRI